MLMTKYVDRIANRLQRRPREREAMQIVQAAESNVRPFPGLTCRGCGEHAQVQLSNDDSDRVEYLCYGDLGPFLELFADSRIAEWTIVRLP